MLGAITIASSAIKIGTKVLGIIRERRNANLPRRTPGVSGGVGGFSDAANALLIQKNNDLSGVPANVSMSNTNNKPDNSMMLLIGGVLVAFLILPKLLRGGR